MQFPAQTKLRRLHRNDSHLHGLGDLLYRLRQFFDDDVFVPSFTGWPSVDLQADNTTLFNCVIGLEIVDSLIAIDPEANSLALAPNPIVVPVIALQNLAELCEVGFSEDSIAPGFIV